MLRVVGSFEFHNVLFSVGEQWWIFLATAESREIFLRSAACRTDGVRMLEAMVLYAFDCGRVAFQVLK